MKDMTQEDKELLLRDLCARLPYMVICNDSRHGDSRITEIDLGDETVYCNDFDEYVQIKCIKPYLRPMSSMTEKEREEYLSIDNRSYSCPTDYAHIPASERIDWLNKNMFDYRGLIERGLAITVTEENNPYEN